MLSLTCSTVSVARNTDRIRNYTSCILQSGTNIGIISSIFIVPYPVFTVVSLLTDQTACFPTFDLPRIYWINPISKFGAYVGALNIQSLKKGEVNCVLFCKRRVKCKRRKKCPNWDLTWSIIALWSWWSGWSVIKYRPSDLSCIDIECL